MTVRTFLSSRKYENTLITALRLSLGIIFFWFGILKVFGYNPVTELIEYSMLPMLAGGAGLVALGIFETVIGLLLLSNRFLLFTHTVLLLHLAGTFSTFIYGWHVVFKPYFPILSLEGEFVVKNLMLLIAGLVVLVHEEKRRS